MRDRQGYVEAQRVFHETVRVVKNREPFHDGRKT